ncbi:hypothetical protein [Mycobacterium sp. 48b]|uniref:hypothetical protein n=1 Tax=Mycobacterium sp. 48b TaxID=3400426 RepID=UPI003AAE74F6
MPDQIGGVEFAIATSSEYLNMPSDVSIKIDIRDAAKVEANPRGDRRRWPDEPR